MSSPELPPLTHTKARQCTPIAAVGGWMAISLHYWSEWCAAAGGGVRVHGDQLVFPNVTQQRKRLIHTDRMNKR